ncbi:hypothetical protein D8I35_03635 [Corticibacter populi]|uniref:Type I restriction endonuclease subunit M n=1 Tax=Corticibacter populi TaxID=1550736 RepID=A0A3M6QYW9_9BURK|nr:hypothetical protein [Corticibacter populi]RMX08215.1 hypothetical protein D8I35_03635 [Corticibacter populi]RZS35483.1 hypothetical protein EV687_0551 [Corticibacter populi]
MQVQSEAVLERAWWATKARWRFPLGRVLMTQGVQALSSQGRLNPFVFIARHAMGEWGNVCDEDRATNDRALRVGARLMSVYEVDATTTVWVITECDRSVTTLLLPSEY